MSSAVPKFQSGLAILESELAQERAATLGRLGRRLEKALADLRAHDEAQQEPAALAKNSSARRELVLEAGEALWYLVIQRELTGFRENRTLMRDYGVPGEVQACMGLRPPRS
jgi:uncharacterized protein DUF6665